MAMAAQAMPSKMQHEDGQHKETACSVEDFSSQWNCATGLRFYPKPLLLFAPPIRSQPPRLVYTQNRDAGEQHYGECGFLYKLRLQRTKIGGEELRCGGTRHPLCRPRYGILVHEQ